MKTFWTTLLAVVITTAAGDAADKLPLPDEEAKTSYSVGYQIGDDFRQQGVTLRRDALLRGIEDAMDEQAVPLMTPEEMKSTLIELKKKIVAEQKKQTQASAEKYRGEGREFLAANAKKDGIVTLPSGLQYKVLKTGSGKNPTLQDSVTVNYRGTLIDGSEFDSSYRDGQPATMPLSSVIPSWKEALPLMREGAKWQLFVPADLAFGERGPLADRAVIYEVELLSVQTPDKEPNQKGEMPPKKP